MSVTIPSELMTGLVSHMGKIRGIWCDIDGGDMVFVSYSRNEYDIVPEDQIEILFKDCGHEKNCRKHKVRNPKVIKRKLGRNAHKRTFSDDNLKVMKRKLENKAHKKNNWWWCFEGCKFIDSKNI